MLATAPACTENQQAANQILEEPTVNHSISISEPRAEMDATLAEVRPIVEETLGADGWRQNETTGGITACDVDLYVYNAPQMLTTKIMTHDQWWQTWPRIREVIERHGYTDGAEIPMEGSEFHLLSISNDRGDEITVSNIADGGFSYGGTTACYPESSADREN